MKTVFLDKKTEYFKDVNSFQIRVVDLRNPKKILTDFFCGERTKLDKMTLKFIWKNKLLVVPEEAEEKEIVRGNRFYSTPLKSDFHPGSSVCVCVCVRT